MDPNAGPLPKKVNKSTTKPTLANSLDFFRHLHLQPTTKSYAMTKLVAAVQTMHMSPSAEYLAQKDKDDRVYPQPPYPGKAIDDFVQERARNRVNHSFLENLVRLPVTDRTRDDSRQQVEDTPIHETSPLWQPILPRPSQLRTMTVIGARKSPEAALPSSGSSGESIPCGQPQPERPSSLPGSAVDPLTVWELSTVNLPNEELPCTPVPVSTMIMAYSSEKKQPSRRLAASQPSTSAKRSRPGDSTSVSRGPRQKIAEISETQYHTARTRFPVSSPESSDNDHSPKSSHPSLAPPTHPTPAPFHANLEDSVLFSELTDSLALPRLDLSSQPEIHSRKRKLIFEEEHQTVKRGAGRRADSCDVAVQMPSQTSVARMVDKGQQMPSQPSQPGS